MYVATLPALKFVHSQVRKLVNIGINEKNSLTVKEFVNVFRTVSLDGVVFGFDGSGSIVSCMAFS